MANKRVFILQRLNSNGVVVGGAGRLTVEFSYVDTIRSRADGAFGVEDIDLAGLRGSVTLETSDITKLIDLVTSTPASTTFAAREAGTSTYHTWSMPGIVWFAGSLRIPKAEDGSLSLQGRVLFTDPAHKIGDVIMVADAVAAGALNAHHAPARLYRVGAASFDPNGAAAAFNVLHSQDLSMDFAWRLLEDYGDLDVGHTSVDRAEPEPVRVSYTHRDATKITGSPATHRAANMVDGAAGVLAVTLLGRGGLPNKTLTIRNLRWFGFTESHGEGFTDYSMPGESSWLLRGSPDTVYTLGGATPLFDFA